MSDPHSQLDARLREQVAALHQAQSAEARMLPLDAQARVRAQLAAEALRLTAERKRRSQLRAASAISLLAAAAALLVYLRAERPAQQAARPAPPEPVCALPELDPSTLAADSGKQLALGPLGGLVTQPGTRLRVEHSDRCELALRLETGTLAGDLHNLRPARLVIRVAEGEVIVTGTRFSVHRDGALEVLLAQGVVDVRLQDQPPQRLMPGSRLRKTEGPSPAQTEPLSTPDAQRLSSWLEPPRAAAPRPAADSVELDPQPRAAAHTPSSSELLAAAEAARHGSRLTAAREAYRSASQGRDANAEVALLRWARMELELSAPRAALRLVQEHGRRFKHGSLGNEAGWLEVQARRALGQSARAEAAARKLQEQHAGTPQAAAARRLLDAP